MCTNKWYLSIIALNSFCNDGIDKTKDSQLYLYRLLHSITVYFQLFQYEKQIFLQNLQNQSAQIVKNSFWQPTIKEKYLITMLYDLLSKQIVYYVNNRYIGQTHLPLNYPGDVVIHIQGPSKDCMKLSIKRDINNILVFFIYDIFIVKNLQSVQQIQKGNLTIFYVLCLDFLQQSFFSFNNRIYVMPIKIRLQQNDYLYLTLQFWNNQFQQIALIPTMKKHDSMTRGDYLRQAVRKQINCSYLIIVIMALIIIFCCFFFLGEIQQLKQQIVQLEKRQISSRMNLQYKIDQEYQLLKEQSQKHLQQIHTLNESSCQQQRRVDMLFDIQLFKKIKEYNFMVESSQHFNWTIFMIQQKESNYGIVQEKPIKIIKKIVNCNQIYPNNQYAKLALPLGRSFFQIKIQKISDNYLGIGIVTQQPLYYFYIPQKNGVFQGSSYFYASKKHSSQSDINVKEKDTITLSYDAQLKLIVWYVNNKYVSHIYINQSYKGSVTPFIVLYYQGDMISIL